MELPLADSVLDPPVSVKAKSERRRSIFSPRHLSLALLSVSIANLCFLSAWNPILSPATDPGMRFLQSGPPRFSILWALLADVACLAALLFISSLIRRSRSFLFKGLGTAVLFVCVSLALYQLGRWLNEPLYRVLPYYAVLSSKIALSGAFLFAFVRFPSRMKLVLKRLFLILAPMLPVFALQVFWSYATVDLRRTGMGQASAPWLLGTHGAPRVVWVVFDEFDERLLFDARPNRIQLPEFDRLRAGTLFADHATPPGPETLWSMPSFLLGRKIYNPQTDTSRLSVQFTSGASPKDFTKEMNVFREARAKGFNTGLAGWYLPYCRLIGQDLNVCTWASLGPPLIGIETLLRFRSFPWRMVYLVRLTTRLTFPKLLAPFVTDAVPDYVLARRYQSINAVKSATENGIRMLRDPRLNFVLIHVAAPHPPGIWDTHKQEFALDHTDYLDNYELADRTLGQIRKTLESTGEWDGTAVLVTSDHPYRPGLWTHERIWNAELTAAIGVRQYPYVPFLLKLPFQRSPLAYHREFNNVLSSRLLLDILEGHVRTAQEAAVWIDQH